MICQSLILVLQDFISLQQMEHVHNTSKFLWEISPVRNFCSAITPACDWMLSLNREGPAIKSQVKSYWIHAHGNHICSRRILKVQNTLSFWSICPIRDKTLQKLRVLGLLRYMKPMVAGKRKAEAKDIFDHSKIGSCPANFFLKIP